MNRADMLIYDAGGHLLSGAWVTVVHPGTDDKVDLFYANGNPAPNPYRSQPWEPLPFGLLLTAWSSVEYRVTPGDGMRCDGRKIAWFSPISVVSDTEEFEVFA